jgi:hypothetical protein
MLLAVDHPIFLKEKESISLEIPFKNMTWVEGAGPQAWNEAILSVVNETRI